MDIFGVGISEIIIILLVILIIGGPRNALKWSRDLGRLLRQARELWSQMTAQLEKDLGEEGREIMNATRELTQQVDTIRRQGNPRALARKVTDLVEQASQETQQSLSEAARKTDERIKAVTTPARLNKPAQKSEDQPAETPEEPTNSNGRYGDWLPPQQD
jgi:sec-independent protein translocase protein TatB